MGGNDDRRVLLEVWSRSGDKKQNASNKLTEEDKSFVRNLQVAEHPIASSEKAILGKAAFVNQMYNQAKNLIKTSAFYQVHRYFNLTENYQAEQDLNNTLAMLDRASDAGSAVINGAIVGFKVSGGNPLGGAVGGSIAAIGFAGQTFIEAWKAYDSQNERLVTMNKQSAFQQTRLGLVDDGRGTMN